MNPFKTPPLEQHLQELSKSLKGSFKKKLLHSMLWGLCGLTTSCLLLAGLGWVSVLPFVACGYATALSIALYTWYRHHNHTVWNNTEALAKHAETWAPSLGSSAQSAVFFTHHPAQNPEAETFIHSHIAHTTQQLAQKPWHTKLSIHQKNLDRRLGYISLSTLAFTTLMLCVFPNQRTILINLFWHGDSFALSETPLVGNIQIRYQFPAYTHVPQKTTQGSDGSISALQGTLVHIHAVSHVPVTAAWIRWFSPNGVFQKDFPVTVEKSRMLSVSFTATETGRYVWALQPSDAVKIQEKTHHPVVVATDQKPHPLLVHPATDLELRDTQNVPILWQATDDFGISEVFLVITPSSGENIVRVKLPHTNNTRAEGRHSLDVQPFNLTRDTFITVHIEAIDTLTPTPQTATSAKRKIQLFNPHKNHARMIEQQRIVLDMLIDMLALDLSAAHEKKAKAYHAHVKKTADTLAHTLKELKQDPLTPPESITALQNIQEHLLKRQEQGSYPALKKHTLQLEADILYLDDLLAVKQLEELAYQAKDVLSDHKKLSDTLEAYRQSKDPATHAALTQQMMSLKQNILKTLEKMASVKKHLPGEYQNMEAHNMHQVSESMAAFEKMLNEGNIEEAAKTLEELSHTLENMLKNIEKQEESYGGEKYDAERKQLASFAEKFKHLEKQQQDLEQQTDAILKKSHEKALSKTAKSIEDLVQKTRALTAKALTSLEWYAHDNTLTQRHMRFIETSNDQLLNLDIVLKSKDFLSALSLSETSSKHLKQGILLDFSDKKNLEKATQNIQEVHRILEKLFSNPEQNMSLQERKNLENSQKQQAQLKKEADDIIQDMQKMEEKIPLFGDSAQKNMFQASDSMQKASSMLNDKDLNQARMHQKRANEALSQLRKDLEKASQKGGKGGLPLPLGTPSPSSKEGQGSSSNSPENTQQVAIPGADHSADKLKLRQELIEAAKQKAPAQYEKAVQRYYEELIQ